MEEHRLALPSGYRIENYEIQAVLGKGGFGITYVAYDWTLGRHMAVKELLPDTIATRIEGSTVVAMGPAHEESWQWARERFVEEARILAGFRHPNIIAVHRLIEANGTVYLVMDHLEGESYETRLRRIGCESDQESLMQVIGPLLDGLQEVHTAGLLHRDIKPENILFDKRGNPVLIDFGAARSTVGATMTMTSIVTHGYSPIEQYQTKGRMGPWTDIYALGAVMCRSITGDKPPVASDRLMEDDFQWLSSRTVSGYSATSLQAVDWALRVRPEDRPQKIADWETYLRGAGVAPAIEEADKTFAIHSKIEPSYQPVDSPVRRETLPPVKQKSRSALIAVVVAVVSAGIFLPTGLFLHSRESEKPVEAAREAIKKEDAKVELDKMIEIPAGEFIYQDGKKVTLPRFFIDENEVTIGQYAEFLDFLEKNPDQAAKFEHASQPSGKSHVPVGWADMKELNPPLLGYYTRAKRWGRYQEAALEVNSPVFGVDWFDAYAYAKWKGHRLPTEEEWEKAARGTDGRKFSWGNNEDSTRANTGSDLNADPQKGGEKDGFKRWNSVDAKKGDKSPYGMLGASGNVSEWTATYVDSPEGRFKTPVIRGGNWKNPDPSVTRRVVKLIDLQQDDALGFRTASDTAPTGK